MAGPVASLCAGLMWYQAVSCGCSRLSDRRGIGSGTWPPVQDVEHATMLNATCKPVASSEAPVLSQPDLAGLTDLMLLRRSQAGHRAEEGLT